MNGWVTAQINNSTSSLNFAFGHEPLFPSKSHSDDKANDPDSRDALVEALSNHHGAYFCGRNTHVLVGTLSDSRGQIVLNWSWAERAVETTIMRPSMQLSIEDPTPSQVDNIYGNSTRPIFGYLLITFS